MTIEEKQAVMDAVCAYMKRTGETQTGLCLRSRVNTSYMSDMMKGVFSYTRDGNTGYIKDIYFQRLADAVGYTLQREYWPIVKTRQYRDIYNILEDAKNEHLARTIIGETGCGKTYTLNRFAGDYPRGTYIITCSRLDCQKDLIRKIKTAIGKEYTGTPSEQVDQISIELSRRYDAGLKPLLVFDESEYLTIPGLLAAKTIYDYLKTMCGIVFMGTDDLEENLKKIRSKAGMKQFYSRFVEVGGCRIRAIKRDFTPFFKGRGFEDRLIKRVTDWATNYRELADCLVPALKAADEREIPLTLELFDAMYHLQKTTELE